MGFVGDFLAGSFAHWLETASESELAYGYAKRRMNLQRHGGGEDTSEMKMISAELLKRENDKKGVETTAAQLSEIYGEYIDLLVSVEQNVYDGLSRYCRKTGKSKSEAVEIALAGLFAAEEAAEHAPEPEAGTAETEAETADPAPETADPEAEAADPAPEPAE